ncbi:uncharacterized protein LOC127834645 [Dreissena polymorpha]|uniref:B box-type domain-containing protein n=1 Tax=Dreissena polymorpha TaxID=45954 RepID=A0A9D4JAP3_DREPO|nr:uncharacterized protein LOC127834645 [Dreissena polymorpha]KAH3806106.1 hypothetical protein DPMN_134420 [Dreissena polymorpha]
MATALSSVHRSSDFVKDYFCDACESKQMVETAEMYCETCQKCFCGKCIKHHGQLYANHVIYGRGDMNKWPLTKKIDNFIQTCEAHTDKKLEMFCDDHSQLCCSNCAFLKHRQCKDVTLISEKVKSQSTDLHNLADKIQTILDELQQFNSKREATIQSVESSYNQSLHEVRDVRHKLNAALDELEKATLKELDDMRTALQASLSKDVDNSNNLKDELTQLSEAVHHLENRSKAELSFIVERKGLGKILESEVYLKENTVKVDSSISFQANREILHFLSKQLSLGKFIQRTESLAVRQGPNHVLALKQKSEYDVRLPSDSTKPSYITGICVISNDNILVADFNNKRVKLLDQKYNVISHCDVPVSEGDMCQISACEVVVTVHDWVQFISVNNVQLVKGRKLQFQHDCFGIAHHEGNLYVTSGTALYQYTLTGTLVKKIYEDTTSEFTVWRCAVIPTGDRIYLTNYSDHKLLTLSPDGTLISTFTDPDLQYPWGVHVTRAGQVLVCGYTSNTVIQVDGEGKRKLATLATWTDGLSKPVSVCYYSNTNEVIVGRLENNKILVLKI